MTVDSLPKLPAICFQASSNACPIAFSASSPEKFGSQR